MSNFGNNGRDDDAQSEQGLYTQVADPTSGASGVGSGTGPRGGLVRDAPATAVGWGRGPVGVDRRKFRYDVDRGLMQPRVSFGASKADRMDAVAAGSKLHQIHCLFGIENEDEARILAFDNALWFEHTINGASMMQPGRGVLTVDGVEFDIGPVKTLLGEDQRRFFRAFADEVARCNREVLEAYDMHDHVAREKAGQVRQVAMERGLQKYPHLAHDSSDACIDVSMEERAAIMVSKRVVLPYASNAADAVHVGGMHAGLDPVPRRSAVVGAPVNG